MKEMLQQRNGRSDERSENSHRVPGAIRDAQGLSKGIEAADRETTLERIDSEAAVCNGASGKVDIPSTPDSPELQNSDSPELQSSDSPELQSSEGENESHPKRDCGCQQVSPAKSSLRSADPVAGVSRR